jgi:hypothetical protein
MDTENVTVKEVETVALLDTSNELTLEIDSTIKATMDYYVISNVINALLGLSIFAMPWGYLNSGFIGGPLVTIFVAYLTYRTTVIMLSAQKTIFDRTGEIKSFPEIASIYLGGISWYYMVKVATVISCLGGCVGSLIFLGDISGQLLDMASYKAVSISLIPLIFLSWKNSIDELSLFTLGGVIAILFGVLVVMIDGLGRIHAIDLQSTPALLPGSLGLIGPSTFMFTIHYCILAMGAERLNTQYSLSNYNKSSPRSNQRRQNQWNYNASFILSISVAYVISCVLIILHGITGSVLFRASDYVR